MQLVEEAVRTWEIERAAVVAQVESIGEEHFDFRPGAGARTFRELAVHVAHASIVLAGEILRPEGSFMNFFDPATVARYVAPLPVAATKAQVLTLLQESGRETAAALRRAGEGLAEQTMPTFYGTERSLTALWFMVGHEMYHLGQLGTYARAIGEVPALTRQLEAMLAGG